MAQITQGNRLYLYQLLSRELGQGRQIMLSQVEEVLLADDIMPCDLDCADVRELMAELSEFCRLTVFKRGRVYATILPSPELDAQLASVATDKDPQQRRPQGRKSFKQKRQARQVHPAKPRPRNRVVEVPPVPEPEAPDTQQASGEITPADATELPPVDATHSDAVDVTVTAEGTMPTQDGPSEEAPAESVADVSFAEDTDEGRLAEPVTQEVPPSAADVAEPTETETAEVPAPVATPVEATPPMDASCDATHTEKASPEPPVTAEVPASADGPIQAEVVEDGVTEPAEAHIATPAAEPDPAPHFGMPARLQVVSVPPEICSTPPHEGIFPDHFAHDVWCTDAALADLYAILPFDVDLWAMLDEDWSLARSCDDFTYEEGVLTFPVRYLRMDGEPVQVSLRRVAGTRGGRRWRLESVECGEEVGLWGLPVADEGAWSHLTGDWSLPRELVSPRRELCRFAHIGNLGTLAESLCELMPDEDWGEDHTALIDYLAATFRRVMAQGKLRVSSDGRSCAFDTGLLTMDLEPISMRFAHAEGTFAWTFDGLVHDHTEPVPEPAVYVDRLSHMMLDTTREIALSPAVADAHGQDFSDKVRKAVAYAARNHRVATCAYDPQTDEVHLLLPVTLEGTTRALVLKDEGTRYLASSVLPLSVAYPYARVVSGEQPAWLHP